MEQTSFGEAISTECLEKVNNSTPPPNQNLLDENDAVPIRQPALPCYDFSNITEIFCCKDEFNSLHSKNNVLRGCKWAPDGTCVLSNSLDNTLRLFNLPPECFTNKEAVGCENKLVPSFKSVLKVKEGGLIYDFCWYPLMSSWDPSTCCFASTSSQSPIHLWDAYSAELRATYRIYDNVDEVTAAKSLNFAPGGSQLYCGLKNELTVFDISVPGREYETVRIKHLKGIVSCISFSSIYHHIMAVGTYSKSIGLISRDDNSLICLLNGHQGGLTHLMFSPDGTKLYSGARKDNEILCWDLRKPGAILFSLQRKVETNQRIYFDLTSDGKYLISGNTCGAITVWDTTQPTTEVNSENTIAPVCKIQAHEDCTNGVSINNHFGVLASASGQHHLEWDLRHILDNSEDDADFPVESTNKTFPENSLKIWTAGLGKNIEPHSQ